MSQLRLISQCNEYQTIIIQIENDQWKELEHHVSNYKNRKKFKVFFHNFLSDKLQKNGVNCWLKCQFNWFKRLKENNNCIWNGVYSCLNHECKNKFEAKIYHNFYDLNFSKTVIVKCENYIEHLKIKRPIRCTGKDRLEQARTIVISGISNVQSQNIIHNELNSDLNG